MAKKDFTNTPFNPFANAKAAAESVIGVPESQNANEDDTRDTTTSNDNETDEEPAIKIKKSRSDKDKEKGRQHLHVILPAYQVDAIKGMASTTGMSVTDFLTKTFDTHIRGDWKTLLEQYHMSQKKLGFDFNPTSKEILGL